MLTHVSHHHNLALVLLAALICAAGGLTTFKIYGHLLAQGSAHRRAWLLLTGFCAGAAIWATHFVAMLAHDTGLPTSYDPFLTAASFAVALGVTTVGIKVSLRPQRAMIAIGGAIIGVGIAAMHFIGMQALITPGSFAWDVTLVVLSIVLGVTFSAAAWVAYRALSGLRALFSGTLLFTVGVCSLHFMAMAALTITPTGTSRPLKNPGADSF